MPLPPRGGRRAGAAARARGPVRARQEARRRLQGRRRRRADRAGPAMAGCGRARDRGGGARERPGRRPVRRRGRASTATRRPLRRGVRPRHRHLRGARTSRASSRCSTISARACTSCNVRLEELLRVEIYRRGPALRRVRQAEPAAAARRGVGRRVMRGTVVIDCFPESAARYREGHAIVAIDVDPRDHHGDHRGRRRPPLLPGADRRRPRTISPAGSTAPAGRRAGRRPSRPGSTSTTARSRSLAHPDARPARGPALDLGHAR